MKKFLKIALPVLAVVVVLGGVGIWWFVFRDDAPDAASLIDRPSATTVASDASTTLAGGSTVTTPASADGTWTVQPGEQVFVGYRVQEQFGGDTIKKTAVGRTPGVLGTVVIEGPKITKADVAADLSQLKSDSARRDGRITSSGLETATFPTATFVLTAPIVLPSAPVVGSPVKVEAVGDLTLHGVTKPVTLQLEARWNGDTIDVAGSTPIVMADFGIVPPSVGGFVSVDDNGIIELQLTMTKQA